MVQFIDDHRGSYGVEQICRVLPIAPPTYHRAKEMESHPEKRSLRKQNDGFYIGEIKHIWQDIKCSYGARKIWQQLKAKGLEVARCTVERLMRQHDYGGSGAVKTRSRLNLSTTNC